MHEADRYALINDASSVVENVILHCPLDACADHPTSWSPPQGYSVIRLDTTMPPVNPGDIYEGGVFRSNQSSEVLSIPETSSPEASGPIQDAAAE